VISKLNRGPAPLARSALTAIALLCLFTAARGHDIWVQTNANVIRAGDAVHIDLMLGNHGNDHRDFKLASKLAPEMIDTFEVRGPDGTKYDLRPGLADLGYAPNEGYYSARFVARKPGLYITSQTMDKVLRYGAPVRAIRSAKTMFVVSPTLDRVSKEQPGFDRPLGHRLELVPQTNPVTPMGPGTPIKVRLLLEGKPLANARVSFIPRGVALKEGTDEQYERTTDMDGRAVFAPKMGTYYLIVAHHVAPAPAKGTGMATKFSATLTVLVPEVCPCCEP
jgi:uncharacterized GH25 family protein